MLFHKLVYKTMQKSATRSFQVILLLKFNTFIADQKKKQSRFDQ